MLPALSRFLPVAILSPDRLVIGDSGHWDASPKSHIHDICERQQWVRKRTLPVRRGIPAVQNPDYRELNVQNWRDLRPRRSPPDKPTYFAFPTLRLFLVLFTRFLFGGTARKRASHAGSMSSRCRSSSRSWSLVVGIGVVWPTESQP